MHLAVRIEIYLLDRQGFVATRQLCADFDLKPRQLRQDDDRPGLLDDFAVSSSKEGEHGYIHHRYISESEWLALESRLRKHGISELRRVKRWRSARHNILTGKHPDRRELHSGQQVLAL